MQKLFQELRDYFFGLFKDWKSDVIGGVVALFVWLWHPLWGKSMPDNFLLPAIAVCFFAASFRAWQRERRRAIAAEKSDISTEQLAFISEKMSHLSERERCIVRDFAFGGPVSFVRAVEPYGVHPMTVVDIEQKTGFYTR